MKLDKDFKNEVNREVREGSYVANKVGIQIFKWILIIVVISAVLGAGYKGWTTYTDYKIFKQSQVYNEGVLDDLAKYKLEMAKTDDPVEQAAIAETVVNRFANYDSSKIENRDLRKFLDDCLNGKYVIQK